MATLPVGDILEVKDDGIVELFRVLCLVFLDALLSGVTAQPVLNFELSC